MQLFFVVPALLKAWFLYYLDCKKADRVGSSLSWPLLMTSHLLLGADVVHQLKGLFGDLCQMEVVVEMAYSWCLWEGC